MRKEGKHKYIPLSPGEIGCCLSHYYVWQKMLDSRIERCLVVEDDAFYLSKDFIEKFDKTMKYVPKNWDIILIGFWNDKNKPEIQVNRYIYKIDEFVTTLCYLINLKAVKKLMKHLPINAPIDTWLSHQKYLNIYRHTFVYKKKNPHVVD